MSGGLRLLFNFYPRSPCGERPFSKAGLIPSSVFLSTLSLRRATAKIICCVANGQISIHALLAESDFFDIVAWDKSAISIHALLAESDDPVVWFCSACKISIHALLAESDRERCYQVVAEGNFYPRSPCGERREHMPREKPHYQISIHALLAESDAGLRSKVVIYSLFLSTLSLRRATHLRRNSENCPTISIHALLAESDILAHNML